jgi:hypothetical protein
MSDGRTTTPPISLTELRDQLRQALVTYPELRQGLGAALAQLTRVLGEEPPPPPRRDRRRSGLR